MKNVAPKFVVLLLGAVALAGCGGGGGGGGTALSSSSTTPSTIFTSGSGTSSVITLGSATTGPIPLPAKNEGGSNGNTIDLSPSAVPEPNDGFVVLAACGIIAGLIAVKRRSNAH